VPINQIGITYQKMNIRTAAIQSSPFL